jgi:hypothetical protein
VKFTPKTPISRTFGGGFLKTTLKAMFVGSFVKNMINKISLFLEDNHWNKPPPKGYFLVIILTQSFPHVRYMAHKDYRNA